MQAEFRRAQASRECRGGSRTGLVQITIRAMGYDLRLRRSLCEKAAPFRPCTFLYSLLSAAGRLSLPAAENEDISEISPRKAEPFHIARGQAPRALANLDSLGSRTAPTNNPRAGARRESPPSPSGQGVALPALLPAGVRRLHAMACPPRGPIASPPGCIPRTSFGAGSRCGQA